MHNPVGTNLLFLLTQKQSTLYSQKKYLVSDPVNYLKYGYGRERMFIFMPMWVRKIYLSLKEVVNRGRHFGFCYYVEAAHVALMTQ